MAPQILPQDASIQNLRRDVEDRETETRDRRDRDFEKDEVPSKKSRMIEVPPANDEDEDEPLNYDDEDESEEEESDDDTELMEELERIKKERAAERAAKEEREQEEQVVTNLFGNYHLDCHPKLTILGENSPREHPLWEPAPQPRRPVLLRFHCEATLGR